MTEPPRTLRTPLATRPEVPASPDVPRAFPEASVVRNGVTEVRGDGLEVAHRTETAPTQALVETPTGPEALVETPTGPEALVETRPAPEALVETRPAPEVRTEAAVEPRNEAPSLWRRRGLRRGVIVGLVVVVAALILGFAISALVLSDPVQAAGMVQPDTVAQLNFTATAPVSAVLVQPGQRVHRGQLLASQDTAFLKTKLYSQAAHLAADQAKLAQIRAGATAPQAQELGAQVQAAQTALSNAQAAQASAQTLVSSDQQIEATDCATSGATSTACLTATRQTAEDTNALTLAEGTTASATAALAVAQDTDYAGLHPYTQADVEAAQATVAADQAAVAETQNALDQAQLRAPFDGIVGEVNGAAGDVASSDGVKQNSAQSGVPSTPGSGIALFPQAPQTSTQQVPDYASMLTVDSLNTHVVAQVAETDLNSVHVGQEAHVSLPAYPGSDYTALVQSIDPTAVDQDGHASYLVYLRLLPRTGNRSADPPADVDRAGLTADVSF